MSESVAAPAPVSPTPAVPLPSEGPAAGTQPGTDSASSPALSPGEGATESDTQATDAPTSLLSEARPEGDVIAKPEPEATEQEAAPTETSAEELKAEEPKAEEVKAEEAAPEEPKPEIKPEDLPVPEYEPFTLPEGITLAEESLSAFTSILGDHERRLTVNPAEAHNIVQELGQKLVDLYTNEARESAERSVKLQRDVWNNQIETWLSEFRNDPEIGNNRQNTTLSRAAGVLEAYGQRRGQDRLDKVREVFALTGAGNHPEVIRLMNWVAGFIVETPKFVPARQPMTPQKNGSRAERLYPSLQQGAS